MDRFHAAHQDVSVELNVTRHPYSFVGDKPIAKGAELKETWAEALYRYMGSTGDFKQKTQMASRMLDELGSASGIKFDIRVKGAHDRENYYVDSQRLVLWAGRHGKQEEVMSELNALHFSRAQSAGERATLVKAAEAVGLDAAETLAFLDSDELADAVWASYRSTIQEKRIRSIPLFVFNVPSISAVGGPFRAPGREESYVVRGSGNEQLFTSLLELMLRDSRAGKRTLDAKAAPFKQDEWWREPTEAEAAAADTCTAKET